MMGWQESSLDNKNSVLYSYFLLICIIFYFLGHAARHVES